MSLNQLPSRCRPRISRHSNLAKRRLAAPADRAEAEAMLRDVAFVLHLTQTVKQTILQEKACPDNRSA